jgi:hypothetical protein
MNIAGKYAGTMYPIPRPLDPRDFIIEPDVGGMGKPTITLRRFN